jgi:hypothetical protein
VASRIVLSSIELVSYHSYQLHTKFCRISFSQDEDEIIGDNQFGFRCNRSTTDLIFCIRLILEEKLECSETVHQLFIDFKKTNDSVRREVIYYNILIEFGVPMKLLRLMKM